MATGLFSAILGSSESAFSQMGVSQSFSDHS